MEFVGKRILIVGGGNSGISAVKLCKENGAGCLLYDGNEKLDVEALKKKLEPWNDIEIVTGEFPFEKLKETDIAVFSPGVPVEGDYAERIREAGIPLWGEIELAYLCGKGDVIAITGTNGKTTTTSLVGEIMKDNFSSVYVVGNIGLPYTAKVSEMENNSVTIAEISSFQLETIETFHPKISAILNITPDHLDRHHTMDNYLKAKKRIMMNQEKEDLCIINYDDPYREELIRDCKAKIVFFSSKEKLKDGYFLSGEDIIFAENGNEEVLMNIHEMKLLGTHNVENVMAAVAMAEGYGVKRENILNTVKNFSAVEHRIEYVDTINGVEYYNDSKGTNTDAAIKAVEAMKGSTIVIAGGYDKNSSYDEWMEKMKGKVRVLVLLGQTREKIAECAAKHGFTHVIMASSMEEAVSICYREAKEKEAVLLSPACASWGMFPNYEVRGNIFKEAVKRLKEL